MKLAEMTLLVRVAETGSMTRAARQLYLSPAAVSATVARIEKTTGVRIFERTTRSLRPTAEGLVLLDGCQTIVERWQRTLEEVQGTSQELAGVIHLSAPADTTHQLIAPVLARAAEAHPRLEFVLHSSDAVQHLHRDAIDMAIRYGSLPDSALSARKLAECPGILVASPSYLERAGAPSTPSDLVNHRCLTLRLGGVPSTSWNLSDGKTPVRVQVHSPLCSDGYVARQWARSGMGIARKSLFDVIDDLEAGDLVRVLPRHSSQVTPIHVVFPSRRHQPARVRELTQRIDTVFRARAERCSAWLAGAG